MPHHPSGVIRSCSSAIYRYKIMSSSNVLSETAWQIFTRFHLEPSIKRVLTICSNGSAPLNKMAAMPIYGKNIKNLTYTEPRKVYG